MNDPKPNTYYRPDIGQAPTRRCGSCGENMAFYDASGICLKCQRIGRTIIHPPHKPSILKQILLSLLHHPNDES